MGRSILGIAGVLLSWAAQVTLAASEDSTLFDLSLEALLDIEVSVASERNELFELSLEELVQVEVSTASRRAEALDRAPASVTVFSRADLERMGVRWLDELALYVPGMQAYRRTGNSFSFWTPRLRGSPSDFGNELLVLVDGRPQNNGANGNVASHLPRQALAAYERVEIIRGPGSAMYGGNASYGVINLITGEARDGVSVAAGEFGAREGRLRAGGEAGGWRADLSLGHYADRGATIEDAFDAFGLQDSTRDPLRLDEVRLTLDRAAWRVFAEGTRSRREGYYALGALADGFQEHDVLRWEAGLQLRDQPLGELRLSASASAYAYDSDGFARVSPPGFGSIQGEGWLVGVDINEEGQQLAADLGGAVGENQRWNLGLEFREQGAKLLGKSNHSLLDRQYLGQFRREATDLLPDAERRSLGLYAQWQSEWSEAWATTAGLRQDRYDDVGDATSPRLALIYTGLPGQVWKLIHARAFRAPSLSELHLATNPFLLGNEALEPVTLRSTELAWRWAGESLSLELAAYRLTEAQRVTLVPAGAGRVQRANTGELTSGGLEWALRWRIGEGLELGWTGSRVLDWDEDLGSAVGTDRAEDILPRSLSGLSLDGGAGVWSWHLGGQYVGAVPLLAATPYWLWRGRLGYALDEHQTLALTGSNVADRPYDELSDPSGLGRDGSGRLVRAAPQRGRQLMLSWTYRW